MTQLCLASMLHKAADHHLLYAKSADVERGRSQFSCHAIQHAIYAEKGYGVDLLVFEQVFQFLKELGCPIDADEPFKAVGLLQPPQGFIDEDLQQVRYGWLKLAALVAEEEELSLTVH